MEDNQFSFQFAHELDAYLTHCTEENPTRPIDDTRITTLLHNIRRLVYKLKPKRCYTDKEWQFWIPLPTSVFDDYPEKKRWFKLWLSETACLSEFILQLGDYFILLQHSQDVFGFDDFIEEQVEVLNFIYYFLTGEIDKIESNPKNYPRYLERDLYQRELIIIPLESFLWAANDGG